MKLDPLVEHVLWQMSNDADRLIIEFADVDVADPRAQRVQEQLQSAMGNVRKAADAYNTMRQDMRLESAKKK